MSRQDQPEVHGQDLPGLSTAEANRLLAELGPNATPAVAIHPLRALFDKLVAPVPLLLEAAVVLQLALGEYVEAAVVSALIIFNAGLGLFHESSAQATVLG
jgi:H+-transporting ATPase